MSWFLTTLAFRNLTRRKGQAVLIILGLMVSTAVITGSLIAGDSMEYLVYVSTYDNLGEVDLLIQGSNYFDYSYYTALSNNATVQKHVDRIAPIIFLPCAVEAVSTRSRENKAQIFGFNDELSTFGKFIHQRNGKDLTTSELALSKNEIIINDRLAEQLKLDYGSEVRLFINNPSFTLDSVFSQTNGLNSIETTMKVKAVVKHQNLGRIQLDGRTHNTANVFSNLTHLQDILNKENRINSILISNTGDKFTGYKNDQKAIDVISKCLDNAIGYRELGYELNLSEPDYIRINNDDIFFGERIYQYLLDAPPELKEKFVISPVLTYFVNSISLPRNNNIINYSIVSSLDFKADSYFGDFDIKILDQDKMINGKKPNELVLEEDEIIIIDWVAQQLNASVGDTVSMEYMALDRLYNIFNTTHDFQIKYIINLSGKANDKHLMPAFPGLQGKLDCVNWDPSFPVDIDRITIDDREFWFDYSGTPKAYISITQAQDLWSTNLGSITTLKINTTYLNQNTNISTISRSQSLKNLKNELGIYLNSNLGIDDAELNVITVKSDALETASGMAIFPMMFLAFSSTIIIAGMALIVTIFLILSDSRRSTLGMARAIGVTPIRVVKLFMIEGLVYGIIAGVMGVIFGLALGWSIVSALNSIWSGAVQGFVVPFHFQTSSLFYGFISGFLITSLTIYITARKIAKQSIISALNDIPDITTSKKSRFSIFGFIVFSLGVLILIFDLMQTFGYMALNFESFEYYARLTGPVLILLGSGLIVVNYHKKAETSKKFVTMFGLGLVIYLIIFASQVFPKSNAPTIELFFIMGLLLILGFITLAVVNLSGLVKLITSMLSKASGPTPVARYSLNNTSRQPSRTGQTITIFSLVIFLLAALSINIAIQRESVEVISNEERGGYDLIGETAVGVSIDLENSTQRIKNKIDAPVLDMVSINEIKLVGPPGGTCSNMNVRYPPRLLGVNNEFILENDFRFMDTLSDTQNARVTWQSLEKDQQQNNGRVPIVVDYNTLIWIYSGSLGGIYTIQDEKGNDVELEVIGILENTIFGGTFIMSQKNLESLYPNSAEYRYLLFKIKSNADSTQEQIASDLEHELNIYGLDAQPIDELINENREYERSFMVLFQAFLGLGLVLGMIGLGVVTAKSVQERRYEIGVLRALGYTRDMVLKSFLIEVSFITILAISLGLIVGILSSYLAFGSWTGSNYEFVLPWFDIIILVMIIYLVSLSSSMYPAYKASKVSPNEALRRIG